MQLQLGRLPSYAVLAASAMTKALSRKGYGGEDAAFLGIRIGPVPGVRSCLTPSQMDARRRRHTTQRRARKIERFNRK